MARTRASGPEEAEAIEEGVAGVEVAAAVEAQESAAWTAFAT